MQGKVSREGGCLEPGWWGRWEDHQEEAPGQHWRPREGTWRCAWGGGWKGDMGSELDFKTWQHVWALMGVSQQSRRWNEGAGESTECAGRALGWGQGWGWG